MRRAVFWLVLLVPLGAAAVITTARILQPGGALWVQLVAFTPVAGVLYVVVLLVLLLRVLLPGAGWRRPIWVGLAAVVAVPLALHVWWIAPMYVGAAPAAAADTEPLTVLTSNAKRGGIDAVALVQAASDRRADVIVAQEVTEQQVKMMDSAGLSDGWPYRIGKPGTGPEGTMVFSRYPLGEPTAVRTRFASWDVIVSAPSGDLRLLAVHPSPPTNLTRWRLDQATLLRAADGVDLMVGDFNATLDHAPIQRLEDEGFSDAAELTNAGWQPTWPENGMFRVLGIAVPPAVAIDHVLVGSRLTALSTSTVTISGTDHAVVIAKVARR